MTVKEIIACLIAGMDELDEEVLSDCPEEWAIEQFEYLIDSQESGHYGDCVTIPCSCRRCLADEYLLRAERLLSKYGGK